MTANPRNKKRKTVIQHAPTIAERDGGWVCAYCGCNLIPTTELKQNYWLLDPTNGDVSFVLKADHPLAHQGYSYAVVDHKIAVSRGGGDELDNLALCCERCNCRKGAKSAQEYVAWLAVRNEN